MSEWTRRGGTTQCGMSHLVPKIPSQLLVIISKVRYRLNLLEEYHFVVAKYWCLQSPSFWWWLRYVIYIQTFSQLSTILDHHWLHRAIHRTGLCPFNLCHHVHAFKHLAKNSMPAVQPWRFYRGDEELGSISVWSSICHGQETWLLMPYTAITKSKYHELPICVSVTKTL